MIELARRAVACCHWRWLPGMLVEYDERLGGRWWTRMIGRNPSATLLDSDPLPDLTDPATLGCLLALVREAVEPNRSPGDWPMVCTYQSAAKKWGVGAWLNESGKATFAALVLPTFETEAEALVAALEAAP